MTDQELKDLVAGFAAAQDRNDEKFARTEALFAKTEAQMAITDAKLAKACEQLGGIGNNNGAIAEQFFFNVMAAKHELAGISYDFVDKNVTRNRHGLEDEFDIIMVNGSDVAMIETKYKATPRDLERLLTEKRVNFEKLYTEYAAYRHHYGFASFHFTDELKKTALENGLIVLERRGEVMETFLPVRELCA